MLDARGDAMPRVQWRGGELRRHGDRLLALAPPTAVTSDSSGEWRSGEWNWQGRPWVPLGSGSALGLVADRHGDVNLAALPCPLRLDFRHGGEHPQGAHGRLALKDLLQSQGIAPWERSAVPLLREGERIVAVADLWLDAAYRADGLAAGHAAGARGRFRWRRSASAVPEHVHAYA
jgi:tRNA(Ile)-lysidine synthase